MPALVVARPLARALVAVACAVLALAGLPSQARAASPDVVVSQVYGGGGNSGATLRNDFVELFNRGSAPVDVTGWSVQYASSAGSTWQRTNVSGVVPAGGYLLVQQAAGTSGTQNLPAPDATGSIAMSATSGKVALVTNQTNLTCGATAGSCLPNPAIRDFVGYGSSANNFEGSGPTPTLSNTTAALRGGDGCTETDSNAADFSAGAPHPRNSAAPLDPCDGEPVVVECGGPLATEQGVAASKTVTGRDADGRVVDFAVTGVTPSPAPGSIAVTSVTPAAATGGVASATVTVDASVPAGSYSVVVTGTNDDASPQSGSCTLTVNVDSPAIEIGAIQGDGHTSPYVGTQQKTTGVVTVVLGNGFFLQDADGDGDPSTSDGIFVFTGSSGARAVAPGDEVRVRGTVIEFRSSTRPRDLSLTELTSATVTPVGDADVPSPVVIDDRPDAELAPAGIASFERLEGMLVAIDDPVVVGPTTDFGEFVTVASGDASHTTAGGNIVVEDLGGGAVDYNPERIMVDDEARVPGGTGSGTRVNSPQVAVRVGDVATGDIVGALDYQFSNFRVQAAEPVADVLTGTTPGSSVGDLRAAEPYESRIATFNVENLFDCVDAPGKDDTHPTCNAAARADLDRQLTKLALAFEQELKSPELVIIEETENTEVLTGDANGHVPGTTMPALLPRVDGDYDAVSFDASDGRGIEVGFVYDTDRVQLHDAFLATDVLPDAGGIFDGSVFRAGREPLVGLFTIDDVDVTVIGNHFKSKGGPQFGVEPGGEAGDDPLYGDTQPPVRWTEDIRHRQADYVRDLVDLLVAQDPDANVLVGGDLNDFAFGEPNEGRHTVERIASSPTTPLTNVVESVPAAQRYTYVFEGNSQVLDHMLVDDGMGSLLTDQAVAHFNAGFPTSLGDDASVTFAASDHDPLVGYFCTDATAPSLSASATPSTLFPPNHKLVTVEASTSASDDRDADVDVELVSVTSSEPDDLPGDADGNTTGDVVVVDDDTFRLRAERIETGTGRTYTITYRATDACGNATTAQAVVEVPARS